MSIEESDFRRGSFCSADIGFRPLRAGITGSYAKDGTATTTNAGRPSSRCGSLPMRSVWLDLTFENQCVLVAVFGLFGGALANWMIYQFAYFNPRPISPWGPRPDAATPRSFWDRLPVVGWCFLRRESKVHGRGFWIRPLLIELGTAISLVWLFQFETQSGELLPARMRLAEVLTDFAPYANSMFFAHAILFILMVAATFIDFDERIIPDLITIPGTLLGLLFAATLITGADNGSGTLPFMPTISFLQNGELAIYRPTTFDAPWFSGNQSWFGERGLAWGLGIWTAWCFALCDRRWSGAILRRRGFQSAVRHFFNGLFHHQFWKVLFGLWIVGCGIVASVWGVGEQHWHGLFTALVGLAAGGGAIWSIRIVATWALRIEAMGFGDVTLMAMIGAFVGWQAVLIAFFLSPFAAIAIVLIRYVITSDTQTPYGPYLCAGTMLTIVFWDSVYQDWLRANLLMFGSTLLWLCIAMLGLMAFMLFVWRLIKTALFHR
ncbi:MAG: prepilin peptidase [Rubripirellula sp.]